MKQHSLSLFGALVAELVQQLVDWPDAVSIVETIGEQVTLLEIDASPGDRGKIIGRGGELVDAIRQLAACRSGMECRSYRVSLVEDPTATPLSTDPILLRPEQSIETTLPLLIRIIQSVVDAPERVSVNPLHAARTTVFEVSVAPRDVKKLLGRHGKTVMALRRLLASLGTRADRRYLLEVVER